jgi:DNA-binding transcriptional regulator GbsR (MarR family)
MQEKETILVSEDGVTLPVVEVLTGRGFITGKSGSGKSNSASVIIEELLDEGFPALIVDVDGEYYGLKEEYEILHLGADEESDMRVGVEHAEKIAELALEKNIPIILDVSAFLHADEQKEIIKEVCRHLFSKEKKLKKPFLILLEEIHEYIPEGGGLDETGQMLVKIAKRGRKHGLGLCGISQRPANVKKDFITQCDWLVWHRLTWENDTSVVRRVVGSDYADEVQELDDGDAFLMTDWDDTIRHVQFRRKETFDAGATPGLGDFQRPNLKSVSGDILEELEEISEQQSQRQDEIENLREELAEKEEQISELEEELERAQDVSNLAEQFTEALTQTGSDGGEEIQTTIEEIREEKNEEIRELKSENEELREENNHLREQAQKLEEFEDIAERYEQMEKSFEEISEAYLRLGEALGVRTSKDNRRQHSATPQANASQDADKKGISVDYEEFIATDAVQKEIEQAQQEATSPRYVKGVIRTIIANGGPVTYDQIAEELGISSTGHVASAVTALHDRDIVTKSKRGRVTKVDLNTDSISEIRDRVRRRQQSEELMSDF